MLASTFTALLFTVFAAAATNTGISGGLDQKPNLPPTASPQGGPTPAYPAGAIGEENFVRRNTPSNPRTEMQRSTATEIAFQAGTARLTPEARQKLDSLIKDAHKRGQIDQVKVISWGDISYPPTGGAAVPKGQKDLAKNRGNAVESYIEDNHQNLYVETYNMAERPSALQDLLNTSEARVKNSLERAGLAGKGANRGSRAMVMVIVR